MTKSKSIILLVLAVLASLLLGASLTSAMDAQGCAEIHLDVEPDLGVNVLPDDDTHTVVATLLCNGQPLAGISIVFTIIEGPNAGIMQTIVTNASGQAMFTYTYSASPQTPGTDRIKVVSPCQLKEIVTKTWVVAEPPVQPPVVPSMTTWGLIGAALVMGLIIPAALRRRALNAA